MTVVITRVTPNEVLTSCRQILGLPAVQHQVVDNLLLAGLLRRSAGINCPCSRATLSASLRECLEQLSKDKQYSRERVDDAIEALIVGGDLLELNDVVTDDMAVKGTWVFAAPPSFVVRRSRNIFLFGIVTDQDTFLPRFLQELVIYERYTRMIKPQHDLDVVQELRKQGLQQLSESAWFKSPKPKKASTMLDHFKRMLDKQTPSGTVKDLQILDPTRAVTYYRGRWRTPKNENGTFVARRPQEFGAPIWCFACLKDGSPVRILDLPHKRTRWRGCDTAWCLQMAIDHCRGVPQRYRRRSVDGNLVRFDFFSPLPQWAQRRLMIFGESVPPEKCLLSYQLPASEACTEEQHLRQTLWLSVTADSN